MRTDAKNIIKPEKNCLEIHSKRDNSRISNTVSRNDSISLYLMLENYKKIPDNHEKTCKAFPAFYPTGYFTSNIFIL